MPICEIISARFCKHCKVFKPVVEFSSKRLKCKKCLYEIHLERTAAINSKTCTKCKESKPGEEFYYNNLICKSCIFTRARSKLYDPENNYLEYRKKMWHAALVRSREHKVAFEIEVEDIHIPECCPVYGFPLIIEPGPVRPNTPTLDRSKPGLGYVVGNIQVISSKANTIKNNATIEEIEALLHWFRSITNK